MSSNIFEGCQQGTAMSVQVTIVASPQAGAFGNTSQVDGSPLAQSTGPQPTYGFYSEEDNVFYVCSTREEFLEFQAVFKQSNAQKSMDIEDHEIWPFFESVFEDQLFKGPAPNPELKNLLE